MRKVAVLFVAGLISVAFADPIVFDNGAATSGSIGISSQLDTVYPFVSHTADDFMLPAGGNVITGLHWWGSWWNPGPPGNATNFNIYVFADDGGKPTGSGMPDPSPTALKTWSIPYAQVNETFFMQGTYSAIYSYDVDVSGDPFVATPGQTYWISFQSQNVFQPQWGWSDVGSGVGNGQQGFPLLGMPYWMAHGYGEMAFNIRGIPEPASVLLLGLAGLLIRRR